MSLLVELRKQFHSFKASFGFSPAVVTMHPAMWYRLLEECGHGEIDRDWIDGTDELMGMKICRDPKFPEDRLLVS